MELEVGKRLYFANVNYDKELVESHEVKDQIISSMLKEIEKELRESGKVAFKRCTDDVDGKTSVTGSVSFSLKTWVPKPDPEVFTSDQMFYPVP